MELFRVLATLIFPYFLIKLFKFLSSSGRHAPRRSPLPPGSMGWPYVGETLKLYSQDPNNFFNNKIKRYGSIFKTHVLGYPSVVIICPEAVKLVLVSKAHLFKPTFPASKERILGKQGVFFQQGEYHARLRKLIVRAFMPEPLKLLVPHIESIALQSIKSWEGKVITAFQEMKTYTFNVAMLAIFGQDEIVHSQAVKSCYYNLERGYNSMPVNLPGTLFHKAMKARKELSQIVSKILSQRRQLKQDSRTDLLGSLMADEEGLTDEQITDNVIGLIFAARDTTATTITWILKHLAENPSILQAVTEEQEGLMKSKQGSGLNLEDTKRMPITTRVVLETLRVASVLSFTFREAVEDVEFNGYLIPKGWNVLPLFRSIHHNPNNYPDPEKFDPSRFEVSPNPNTFLPFGKGIHSCPGNELAKLQILILLHHLTTKYSWWSLMEPEEGGIEYGPFAIPKKGLPVKISLKK